jgi:hypothetical protein
MTAFGRILGSWFRKTITEQRARIVGQPGRRNRGVAAIACVVFAGATLALAAADLVYEKNLPIDHPAIGYFQQPLRDPVARLAEQLAGGAASLDFQPGGLGYLPSLLERLGVNADSQGLVFSKTSFQAPRISPRNPRAVYFNDEVAIGFVPGANTIELAALDPTQGVALYALDATPSTPPRFARQQVCLKCHQGPATGGVPGIFVSSVFPSASGVPERAGAIVTDHRTAFEDRWGGWYVNGTHGTQRHRGNAVAPDPAEPQVLETEGTQNLTSLVTKSITATPLRPVSDIVALMTFEHQTQMTNVMTRLGWEARMLRHDGETTDYDRSRLESRIEEFLTYMLFADEAPLRASIEGVSTFSHTFPQRGPHDRKGRSLRDFDLRKRLFRYPLSYMVYSAAFDALPDNVRGRIYQRLYAILSGRDSAKKFARLAAADRNAILEILRDTKPDLPAYWRDSVSQ